MRAPVVLLAAGALALAGCGSSSSSGSSSGSSSKSSATPAATQTAPSGAAKATIKNFTFTPGSLTVKAGTTVTFTNQDSANHNVTFSDKSIKGIANLRTNQSGKVSFAKAGSYAYVCTYHPGMKGTVVVQ
jgi:plastocyanin